MTSKAPILLLSSGAKPRYLEDIVRALALPDSCELQFRYDQEYASQAIWEAITDGKGNDLKGRKAYIAYLDNRVEDVPPTFVPVREAEIVRAKKSGRTLIISMRVRRYFDVGKAGGGQLESLLREIEPQDNLPTWKVDRKPDDHFPFTGYWVNFLKQEVAENRLVPHDATGGSHLAKVSDTAEHLCSHVVDFNDYEKRLFFNIIGLEDSNKKFLTIKDGVWTIEPSRTYKLWIFHIRPKERTHLDGSEIVYFGTSVFGESIELLGVGLLRADSSYDEKYITVSTKEDVRTQQSTLTLYRTRDPSKAHELSADVSVSFSVKPSLPRLVAQWTVLALGIAGPACVAAFARLPEGQSIESWQVGLIVLGGVAAATASVFGLRRAA